MRTLPDTLPRHRQRERSQVREQRLHDARLRRLEAVQVRDRQQVGVLEGYC